MESTNLSMKLLIDTKDGKVLFAEANKDVVDLLISFLSLPLGTLIKLVSEEAMVGSLGNIYQSVSHMSDAFLNQTKSVILSPKLAESVTNVPLLFPSQKTPLKTLYKCVHYNKHQATAGVFESWRAKVYVVDDINAICPKCKEEITEQAIHVPPPTKNLSSEDSGFVKGVVSYMVADDLVVTPISTMSSVTMLQMLNIGNVRDLQHKVVNISRNEVVMLLRASLYSKTVLTDVFVGPKVKI